MSRQQDVILLLMRRLGFRLRGRAAGEEGCHLFSDRAGQSRHRYERRIVLAKLDRSENSGLYCSLSFDFGLAEARSQSSGLKVGAEPLLQHRRGG